MAIVISVCNHKGGVSKTTTVVNLSAALAMKMKQRVLVVDMDPQANASKTLLPVSPYQVENTVMDLFRDEKKYMSSCISSAGRKNLDIIPTNIEMLTLEKEILNSTKAVLGLKSKLDDYVMQNYDFILIDCPPSLGNFVLNALTVSDYYIIPIGAEDKYALDGIEFLDKVINIVKKDSNPKLKLMKILISLYDARTSTSTAMDSTIRKYFGNKEVFRTIINRNTDIARSVFSRKVIYEENPKAQGSKDFLKLAQEVIRYVEKETGNNVACSEFDNGDETESVPSYSDNREKELVTAK